jgi:hypothetical protein
MVIIHLALAFLLFVVALIVAFWGIRALWLAIKDGLRGR